MANSTTAHIRNLREHSSHAHLHDKEGHLSNLPTERKKLVNQVVKETLRLEKYCKYWSILSNVAALVSVSSAIYGIVNKKRFW